MLTCIILTLTCVDLAVTRVDLAVTRVDLAVTRVDLCSRGQPSSGCASRPCRPTCASSSSGLTTTGRPTEHSSLTTTSRWTLHFCVWINTKVPLPVKESIRACLKQAITAPVLFLPSLAWCLWMFLRRNTVKFVMSVWSVYRHSSKGYPVPLTARLLYQI